MRGSFLAFTLLASLLTGTNGSVKATPPVQHEKTIKVTFIGDAIVPTTVTATTTTTTIPAPKAEPLVPAYIVEMWEKVATCETGGRWWRNAPYYDGGLGISRRNWDYFAPDNFPDAPHLASKEQQVFVARKIQAWGGVPNYVPDQAGGCHAW